MLENFKVIPVADFQKSESVVTIQEKRLIFSRKTAVELGNAKTIQILMNAETHEIAIQACEENCENAIPFTNKNGTQNYAVFVGVAQVQNAIRGMMGWNDGQMMKATGIAVPAEKAIIYRLDEAVPYATRAMVE